MRAVVRRAWPALLVGSAHALDPHTAVTQHALRTWTDADGLPDDTVISIAEGARGELWISTNRGIDGVAKRELDEIAVGARKTVQPIVLGAADSMRSRECNGALDFAFTALDYGRPQQRRFRYPLEGFDESWVEAGPHRVAHYTNIPPGRHRFLVAAASPGGPWSEAVASAAFVLQPRFRQTGLFRALAALALLAALAALYRWRTSHHARRARKMTSLAREREQAAADVRKLNAGLEERVAQRTAQLEEAVKDLESFAYSVSHDLRAPLRAIDNFSTYLLEDHAAQLDAEGQRLLGVIRGNVARMNRLINDVVEFSRAGRAGLGSGRVDMQALAAEVFAELQAGRPQPVAFEAADLPAAEGDPKLVRQVLVNLIGNALKFSATRERPEIAITAHAAGDQNVYAVRDNGVGFDPAYAHKLFGVFQRLHPAREFEGTGVGLAIVKRIVARHGGRVWAEGRPGAGATFSFSLPAARRHAAGTLAAGTAS